MSTIGRHLAGRQGTAMSQTFLTVDDVAERLHVSKWAVWDYIRSGDLRAAKVGRHYLIRPEDLDQFVTAHVVQR
jgi:excisionase family DNA binding protein